MGGGIPERQLGLAPGFCRNQLPLPFPLRGDLRLSSLGLRRPHCLGPRRVFPLRLSPLGLLLPRQRLVVVTDGLLEARRPRRWWMRGPLSRPRAWFPAEQAIAQELSHGPAHEGLDRVLERADAWTGYRRDDDRALLVLEPHIVAGTAEAPAPATVALA